MEPLSANDPPAIGGFRLHARLGAGGMGQVYLGFSPAGHAVAIKVIHPQFATDQEFLRRFSNEVAAASAVGGMYTAPVVAYDLSSATPWLATAYVPGPTLATFVSKHGPLPEPAAWRLAAGLAEALQAVHAKGLVHRDLKPANVLLADSGPHVIDFGISRASSSMTQLTGTGMTIGTPSYMSPEQAEVRPVGPASDIFSLGSVLGFAATGAPPFTGDNPATLLYRVVSHDPDLSAVPPRFRQVVEACLKKNPEQRPTPGQLISMISELGPALPVKLGSFWPDDVARAIAREQAAQTPSGLTPPGPFTGTSGSPGLGSPGHTPMIADGYLAAAQRPPVPSPVPPGPSVSPMPAPPYSGQQPYVVRPPGGQVPSGQVPFGQAASGQAPSWQGIPAAPYPGQQPYLGPPPGARNPMSRYAPGRRRPTAADVPPMVRTAITLMGAGLVVTVVAAVLSSLAYARYDHDFGVATAAGLTAAANHAHSMAGAMSVTMSAEYLGLIGWIWLAIASRRGNGRARIAGLVLLGIYTCCVPFVLFGTHGDLGPQLMSIVVWGVGVASVIPLWSRQAREFSFAWRGR